jgi:hypothetical protein
MWGEPGWRLREATRSAPIQTCRLPRPREKAIDMRHAVAKGTNPVEEKRRYREQAMTRTFGALADRYLKEHARRFKKTAEADERVLTVHILPKWGPGLTTVSAGVMSSSCAKASSPPGSLQIAL